MWGKQIKVQLNVDRKKNISQSNNVLLKQDAN